LRSLSKKLTGPATTISIIHCFWLPVTTVAWPRRTILLLGNWCLVGSSSVMAMGRRCRFYGEHTLVLRTRLLCSFLLASAQSERRERANVHMSSTKSLCYAWEKVLRPFSWKRLSMCPSDGRIFFLQKRSCRKFCYLRYGPQSAPQSDGCWKNWTSTLVKASSCKWWPNHVRTIIV
jgi:hypothetical protein